MALSKAQSALLEKCKVPLELQQSLANSLNDQGAPKENSSVDFLIHLCDELQVAEEILREQRLELSLALGPSQNPLSEESNNAELLEETIKITWSTATALWRAADQVITHPDTFNITLQPKYAEHALLKKNLSVVGLIKWARPDFFTPPPPSIGVRYLAGFFGAMGGGMLGLVAGALGGIQQGYQKLTGFKIIGLILYIPWGILSGSAMGFMTGATFGFRTGNSIEAWKLGAFAAYTNPFYDRRGTKNYQAVQLQIEETLFNLACINTTIPH